MADVNGLLYFAAAGKLWKTDGTAAHTTLLANINPVSPLVPVGTGANGRVNVTTNFRQYALLDLAEPGQPSDWQLLVAGTRTHFKPFDRAVFLKLLSERS
jgi:hypothetical protein